MTGDCPYCSIAMKSGELYCSKHGHDMGALKSGVFYIKARRLEECDPHITRLSLNFNLDSKQTYRINNKAYVVSPLKYLLINEGNAFTTYANTEQESRMITLAFQAGLPAKMFKDLTSTIDQHLDNPHATTDPAYFLEQTYAMDDFLLKNVRYFASVAATDHDHEELQETLEKVLLHILTVQQGINAAIHRIDQVKVSTRQETYKRLQAGYDFIQDHYEQPITCDMIAQHACLSTFNFKRLFKSFYRESPYQVIKRLRLKKAVELLSTKMPVKQVCIEAGWQDPSSFVRLFKSVTGFTPEQYRQAGEHHSFDRS